ncbi:aldehyde dehydrogenase domain-containing protein [Thelonectria olida]|uniref:Aldehyde dehydrogenase domain-containing protein n=1 Tax=Thelonectria olida TaxID=1576542 RepID=A0A9P8VUX1_9HYPO|nr:aldehyde dehydrogenase domain-containing protein [Thelonectria olida]
MANTATLTQSSLSASQAVAKIPLIIEGTPVFNGTGQRIHETSTGSYFQGAEISDCQQAVQSSSNAFCSWSKTSPLGRRRLLLHLAQLLHERQDEIKVIIQTEIHCSEAWAARNVSDSIALIEESASLITSRSMNGSIPHTDGHGSFGFVFNRPLGVILGIAPWNGPLILGFRAVVAPVATGNTAILKGSELSPRTHHFIAQLFVDAGFPPGVVNFILHRPQDAADVVKTLITHPAVRKINFTGSTAVGRIISETAGRCLKPVLLELGGKNCAIVLKDADVSKAVNATLQGATLNGGQICMSTDLAIVTSDVADSFKDKLRQAVEKLRGTSHKVIIERSAARSLALSTDANGKGAKVTSTIELPSSTLGPQHVPVTLIENVQSSMDFFSQESFGPLLGVVVVDSEEEAIRLVNECEYGLSCAIWTQNHHHALELAQRLDVGAVHINASTVHDEATLPHGGSKLSGFGRFGAEWGLQEFVQTQTVILNP